MAWDAGFAENESNFELTNQLTRGGYPLGIVVNQAGVVYERDFGPDTENIVAGIKTFNPGDKWSVVED